MKWKKVFRFHILTAMFALFLVLTFVTTDVYAEDRATGENADGKVKITATPTPVAKVKKGLIKEKAGYRYYVRGKPVKNQWKKIKGSYYWFKSNGIAARGGACKVKGVYYIFDQYARKVVPKNTKVVKIKGISYIVDKKGRAVKGWKKFGSKVYYAYQNGKCVANKTVDGIRLNKNGYTTSTKALCKMAARNFIARYTTSGMSRRQKLRACFNQIIWYNRFVGYMDPTPSEFKTKTWVYKYALQMFQNGLTGNCYGISSSVAAVAKELGYQPYVITIPDGHSFVMIDGLYYDNMYGTLFGTRSRPSYTVQYRIKF